MFHYPYVGGWGIGVAMMILWMLLLIGLLIGGVYLLSRILGQPHTLQPTPMGPSMARQRLDKRLAAGEITPDEYDVIRKRIEG